MPQKIVMLDAVGTTIYPFPPVAEAYYKIASGNQITISKSAIKRRFYHAVEQHFCPDDNFYSQVCSDESDRELWRRVVQDVFESNFTDSLFSDLWSYFAQPDAWNRFSDVVPLINDLQSDGFVVGIASNFDSRLEPIIKKHISDIPEELVYYSTGVGFAKPDVRFFKEIESRLQADVRSRFLMIGDNWALDVEAAKRCGWNAIWKSGETLPSLEEIKRHF